jgi:SAM-dependent methyltransferase
MSENRWLAKRDDVPRGPDYDARMAAVEERGQYMHGEADRVQVYEPRTVLDAGCGTGRVAVELARRGLDVVGVDLDPSMLEVARTKSDAVEWIEADLADLDLGRTFDVVVAPGGTLICGFSLAGDHLSLETHHAHCAAAGLRTVEDLATWEGEPYDGGDYVVSVHRRD